MLLPEELQSGEIDLATILDSMEAAASKAEAMMAAAESETAHLAGLSRTSPRKRPIRKAIRPPLRRPRGSRRPRPRSIAGLPRYRSCCAAARRERTGRGCRQDRSRQGLAKRHARSRSTWEGRSHAIEAGPSAPSRVTEGGPLAQVRAAINAETLALPTSARWRRWRCQRVCRSAEDASLDRILSHLANQPDVPTSAQDCDDSALHRSMRPWPSTPQSRRGAERSPCGTSNADGASRAEGPVEAIASIETEMASTSARIGAALDKSEAELVTSLAEMRQSSPEPVAPEETFSRLWPMRSAI